MSAPVKFSMGRMPQSKPKPKLNFCSCVGILFFIILLIVGLFGLSQYSIYNTFAESKTLNKDTRQFTVNIGDSLDSIIQRMADEGIIDKTDIVNVPAYKIYFQLNSIDSHMIQAGTYAIPPEVNTKDIISYLKPTECEIVGATFKEGTRIEEFAEVLEKVFSNEPSSKYNSSEFISIAKNLRSAFSDPKAEMGLSFNPPNNVEGFLFPDTYQLCLESTPKIIIQKLLKTFDSKAYIPNKSIFESSSFKPEEIVNIASMIERETFTDQERFVISGIIYKRLDIGETLGIDATTQYGAGYSEVQKTWWRTGVELDNVIDINTPYNTRKNGGLPPTPISNPGLSSINAALRPQSSAYLFYIHDAEGNVYYGKTQAEHERNICKYLTFKCR